MKALASRRLAALTDPALDALEHAITQRDNPLVSLKAAQDAMDRNGIGAIVESKVRASQKDRDGGRIVVNIGFLGSASGEPNTIVVPAKQIEPSATPEREES